MISLAKKIVKSVLRPLIRLTYKKECPVCGQKVKEFRPLPDFYAETAKAHKFPYTYDQGETLNYKEYSCPCCDASDRDRLYALYINRNLQPGKRYKLLDIAPAKSLRKFLKSKDSISYRSADLIEKDVDDTGVDIMNMPYQDNAFDIFICSHVLEHVPDDRKAMRELRRVLSNDGFGITMVPIITGLNEIDEDPTVTDVAERWRRFGQDDHVRLYNGPGLTQRLKEAGFVVTELTIKNFKAGDFFKYGISSSSVLYIVKK